MDDCVFQKLSSEAPADEFTILQVTDTHLYAEHDNVLLGINTAESFQAVLNAVLRQNRNFEAIIATGDLSQDYTRESYKRFADLVKPLNKPVYWLPGNHDDGPLMRRVMPEFGISTARCVVIGKWQFVLLNTQVYSVPHGWIMPDQLAYLKTCLQTHPDLYTVVCLHHNTFPLDSAWLDQHELRNKQELLEIVYSNPQVKLVLCGHVHQEHDFVERDVRFISTPSTSIQFLPYSFNFSLDQNGPGWRYLTFKDDGAIETEVYPLTPGLFVPDFPIGGY